MRERCSGGGHGDTRPAGPPPRCPAGGSWVLRVEATSTRAEQQPGPQLQDHCSSGIALALQRVQAPQICSPAGRVGGSSQTHKPFSPAQHEGQDDDRCRHPRLPVTGNQLPPVSSSSGPATAPSRPRPWPPCAPGSTRPGPAGRWG